MAQEALGVHCLPLEESLWIYSRPFDKADLVYFVEASTSKYALGIFLEVQGDISEISERSISGQSLQVGSLLRGRTMILRLGH